jgi:hypothetical protein
LCPGKWCKIHSTNTIEQLNGEVKRRSDVVGILSRRVSTPRLGTRPYNRAKASKFLGSIAVLPDTFLAVTSALRQAKNCSKDEELIVLLFQFCPNVSRRIRDSFLAHLTNWTIVVFKVVAGSTRESDVFECVTSTGNDVVNFPRVIGFN